MSQGRSIATEHFLLAHAARLRAYAHVILGADDDVEDVLQNVWLKYVRAGPAATEHAERWLFTVCRNEAMDVLRAAQQRRARQELVAAHGPAAAVDPAEAAATGDATARVEQGLARLPAEQREMVYLKFAEDLSLAEIAERTGVPKSTVGLRVQEGLALLNRYFQGASRDV